ncbi:MAG: periplasmic heavy metal sensor [Longimicrobiales bacterium]
MKTTLLLVVLLAIPSASLAQAGGRGGVRQMQSRSQLEARVYQRFLEQSGRELGLSSDERSRLRTWLQDSQGKRRELTDHAEAIRRRLLQAVANPQTTDAEFESVLADLNELRDREHDLWRSDQHELAELLPPRKRAQFVVRLLRLQDAVRDLIQQRDTVVGNGIGASERRPGEVELVPAVTVEAGNPFLGAPAPIGRTATSPEARRPGLRPRPSTF